MEIGKPPLDSEASTGWFGQLSEIPLFAVLRRVQRERLTGTLTVSREDQSLRFYFQNGELRTVNSSREEHRIGASLVCWGYITREELETALERQRESRARLDQILVESGMISRAVMDAEARRLMEQIVLSTLSWRNGDFHFLNNTGQIDPDIAISLSVTEMIMEGIRRIPESEQFLASLGDLSNIPASTENPTPDSNSLRLPPEVAYFLSRIDGKTNAQTLLKLAPGSRMAAAKILSALIYCGFVEMRQPEIRPRPAQLTDPRATSGKPPETPVPRAVEEEHRDFVRNTYRRIDWLSHYDLLGISTDSTLEEIEEAYRIRSRLVDPALRHRPDLADCGRELDVLSERLRVARETLTHSVSRESYNLKIAEAQAVVWARPTSGGQQQAVPSDKLRQWTASQSYKKAKELIEAKDFFPAIQMLTEAVHFAPDNAEYRYLLGLALLKNRLRRENALEYLEDAAQLDPSRPDIRASLAEAYLEQGAIEQAQSHVHKARELDGKNESYRELERRIAEAARILEEEHKRGRVGRFLTKSR